MRNYRKHLNQPYYIQRIQDFSLPFPIRLDKVLSYLIIIFILFVPLKFLIDFESLLFSKTSVIVVNLLMLPLLIMNIIDRLELEGKTLVNYLLDVVKYFINKILHKDIYYKDEVVRDSGKGLYTLERVIKYKKNLILKSDNTIWAYYLINSQDCLIIDDVKKSEYKILNSSFLNDLSKYKYLELKMIPIDYNIEYMLKELAKSSNKSATSCCEELLQRTYDYIDNELFVYKWILGVCIKSNETLVNGFKDIFTTYKNKFSNESIDLSNYEKLENEVYKKVVNVGGKKLSDSELYYYLRLNYSRGFTLIDETIEFNDSEISFNEYGICKTKTYTDNDIKESYSVFLPLISTIDNLQNCNFCEEIQKFNFKVELHFFIKFEEIKGSFGLKRKAVINKNRLKEVVNDEYNASGEYSTSIYESKIATDELIEEIENNNKFISFSLVSCLT